MKSINMQIRIMHNYAFQCFNFFKILDWDISYGMNLVFFLYMQILNAEIHVQHAFVEKLIMGHISDLCLNSDAKGYYIFRQQNK